jgi:hypothetical protein
MAYAELTCILLKRERNNENNFLEIVFEKEWYDTTYQSNFLFFIWEKFLKKLDKIGKIVL